MAVSFIVGGNQSTRKKRRPAASRWQTLSDNIVSSTLHLHRVQAHISGDRHLLHRKFYKNMCVQLKINYIKEKKDFKKYIIIYWKSCSGKSKIDWLVFNSNISNISAISWHKNEIEDRQSSYLKSSTQ